METNSAGLKTSRFICERIEKSWNTKWISLLLVNSSSFLLDSHSHLWFVRSSLSGLLPRTRRGERPDWRRGGARSSATLLHPAGTVRWLLPCVSQGRWTLTSWNDDYLGVNLDQMLVLDHKSFWFIHTSDFTSNQTERLRFHSVLDYVMI